MYVFLLVLLFHTQRPSLLADRGTELKKRGDIGKPQERMPHGPAAISGCAELGRDFRKQMDDPSAVGFAAKLALMVPLNTHGRCHNVGLHFSQFVKFFAQFIHSLPVRFCKCPTNDSPCR